MWNPQNYHADRLKKLNLNLIHVAILDWFLYFNKSGNMKLLGKEDGYEFYWVTYKKMCSDLLLPFSSNYKINECFKELCGVGKEYEDYYPLIKKVFRFQEGHKIGLAYRQNITDWLRGTEGAIVPSFFNDDDLPTKKINANQKAKKQKVNKNALAIFENIKKIELNGKPLFNHKSPDDDFHYTSLYNSFQNTMLDLYQGYFLQNYKLDIMADWFLRGYKFYLDREKIIEKIKACKNNWTEINNLMVTATKNYKLWFDPSSEVQDKSKLKKNINTFIYFAQANISMFYCCILYKPTGIREAITEKIYDKLPGSVLILVNPILKKENYDSNVFYRRINSLVTWFNKNAESLCKKDSNCSYWLQSRKYFMENYLEWIKDTIGDHPKIGNFGLGKTFDWYVNDKIKEHGISIEIQRSNEK
jgi:hypothetical protein